MKEEIIYRGKLAGIYDAEAKTYTTNRTPNMYLVARQGFAISVPILDQLREKGCEMIVLFYEGKKGRQELHSTLDNWIRNGSYWECILYGDKEPDQQIALSMKNFEKIE